VLKGSIGCLSTAKETKYVYHYSAVQRTFEVGRMKIGGQPGLTPTVLIGSIFYAKDKLVQDPKKGVVQRSQVEEAIEQLSKISEATGLPSMLDVVGATPDAMKQYISLLSDITEMPLLIDGSGSNEVNLAGIKRASELGIMERVVLNSIVPETDSSILEEMHGLGLKNAVVLAFDSGSMASSKKRLGIAEELLNRSLTIGIQNIMIDTGVVDMLTLGIACKALRDTKDKLGFPVGCGAHNAVNTWVGLVPKFGREARDVALAGSSLMPVVLGADFVLYGPIRHAPIVFPSIAMIDTALSGVFLEEGIRPDRQHPRFRIG